MSGVPYVFGNATTSIPLSNLDANFNTPITLGNTTVGLGNTVTTLGNVTLTNSTITNAASISVLTGGLNFNTSGQGVTFNNSYALTNSVLNDYETGTWTPVVTPLAGTLTSYASSGRYTKIGKLVALEFQINITNAGTASSNMNITGGIPFVAPVVNSSAGVISEDAINGVAGTCVFGSASIIVCKKYDGTTLFTTGAVYGGQITYQGTF